MNEWIGADTIMQRWHLPFEYVENNWTWSQYLCLMAATTIQADEAEKARNGGKDQMKATSFFSNG